ncbi:hypothetical protein [Peptacetobacter sp.]|uniref:hypothetical protein n=1 Tax=Peptacetobacter sp. TaxID=2991975 RepID=UPI002614B741|nr:hypothetical protein [Peptacetobacter sp.]
MKKTTKTLMIATLCAVLVGGVFAPTMSSVSAASKPNKVVTTTVENKKLISKKEALNILKKMDNSVEYIFMGTEKDFDALSSKKLKGFVFLPDEEGDMGYFVNSKNRQVFYFHPSGYMERIQ